MNTTDRHRLQRLENQLSSIPKPQAGGGTQSSAFTGFVAYANDMREAEPALRMVLNGLIYLGLPGWYEGDDYQHPDGVMDGIAQWIKAREAVSWQSPTPPIEPYLAAALLERERKKLEQSHVQLEGHPDPAAAGEKAA